MQGTIAITDRGWYERLARGPALEEVNFWKPSAGRTFVAPEFSPFLFKLRAPENAICGFGYFARYSRLPDWLAWETFGEANGCYDLDEMRGRIAGIRERIRFRGDAPKEIGCVLIVQPVFFSASDWVRPPFDWPARTQADKKYDLSVGEGARVWGDCLISAGRATDRAERPASWGSGTSEDAPRYGSPILVAPRLGQGTFRIAVTEAYGRGCAITGEHSLPVLDAAHIKPYQHSGPHRIANGLLLRADLHRLFDKGYLTVSVDRRVQISSRLREDFENGKTYYPLHGSSLFLPKSSGDQPAAEFLGWHNENVYLG